MTDSSNTFPAGTRVRDTGRPSRVGTVVPDPQIIEYPGMIPVLWDNSWRTFTAPEVLEPLKLSNRDAALERDRAFRAVNQARVVKNDRIYRNNPPKRSEKADEARRRRGRTFGGAL